MDAAEAENTARLLRDDHNHNSSWEMASLRDKDKWLRRLSFAIFSAPFFWALVDPAGVRAYFSVALEAMPEWFVRTYMTMVGGIWGVSALKNTVPGLLGGVVAALKGARK